MRNDLRLGEQADDEKRFALEIEEIAGMNENAGLLEQIEHDRFLGSDRRHLHDGVPASFDRQHRARRMSRGERSTNCAVVFAHALAESALADAAPALSSSGAATCTGVDTDR